MSEMLSGLLRTVVSTPVLIGIFALVSFFVWLGSWRTEFALEMLAGERPEVTWSAFSHTLWGTGRKLKQMEDGDACPALWETELGDFWSTLPDGDLLDFLITEQTLAGTYHRKPVAVRNGDIVFDVGSHLGVFTRMALKRGAGKVIAIEPASKNIACFKKTFAPELAAGKVILVEAAAWNESTTLNFKADEGYHGSARGRVGADGTVEVPAVTIDGTVERLELEAVDFIKMDIEGAERIALRGAANTISRFRPRMAICVYHGDGSDHTAVPEVVEEIQPEYQVIPTPFVAYFN